jgi:hypothetical protein
LARPDAGTGNVNDSCMAPSPMRSPYARIGWGGRFLGVSCAADMVRSIYRIPRRRIAYHGRVRRLALLLCLGACGGGQTTSKGPDPIVTMELPAAGGPTFESARPVKKGETLGGDVPFGESRFYRFTLAEGESVLAVLTTRIPGGDMYPVTHMQILDVTRGVQQEWRSSLWNSKSNFAPEHGGDYVLQIENAQYPDYPLSIHYTVDLR